MSEAAVIERPVTETTETKGDAPDATTLPEAEDVEGKLQTGTEGDTGSETASEEPDAHLAELERESADAQAKLDEERIAKGIEEREKQRQAEARENARKEKVRNAVPSALERMGKLTEGLSKLTITDAEGEPYSLNPKAFTNIIEGLGLSVEEAISEKVNASYDAAFMESLGADAIDGFWEAAKEKADAEGNVPVSALLELHAESKALQTRAVKSLTLEQAKELSPTLKKQLVDGLKAEFERGRANPLPSGEPESNGTTVTVGAFTLTDAHDPNIERLAARRAQQKRERGY